MMVPIPVAPVFHAPLDAPLDALRLRPMGRS